MVVRPYEMDSLTPYPNEKVVTGNFGLQIWQKCPPPQKKLLMDNLRVQILEWTVYPLQLEMEFCMENLGLHIW